MPNRTEDHYEHYYWSRGKVIMGIDEAGRGPICGPLVVACCVLPLNYHSDLIDDSKRLSAKRRDAAYDEIVAAALFYDWRIVSAQEIDRLNIYAATKKAMRELASNSDYDIVLTDAMPLELNKTVISLIKGDRKSINIAAASILAKVTRDRIMLAYHRLYPELELDHHKGYPTKRHLELIKKYGLKDFYRLSYAPCKKILTPKLFSDLKD